MPIEEKKDAQRGSYSHFIRARGAITLLELKRLYQENFIKPVVG